MNNISVKNKSCAIIPFYNESDNLADIISQALVHVEHIIAVNDGSTDNSLEQIPRSEQITILSFEQNQGKGFALREGFKKSIELSFEFTVTIDADFQHHPDYIPTLLAELKYNDIVIGNRLRNIKSMPIQRVLSNKLTSLLLSLKVKQKILDSQCGFRAFRTEILKDILPSLNGFEAESEIIVNAARKNLNINFVHIPTIYGKRKSKMKSFDAIKGFLKVLTL